MNTTTSAIAPRVHDNGTNPLDLADNLDEVWSALCGAAQALRDCAPNPRDYDGPEHHAKAIAQHERRQNAIQDLMAGIVSEVDQINQQVRERKVRLS